MQAQRSFVFGAVPKTALAGLLAVLLVTAGTLSVDVALHQALHDRGAVSHHLCLVCSLVNGQLSAESVVSFAVGALFAFWFCTQVSRPFVWPASDFRLSPSRAPPVR